MLFKIIERVEAWEAGTEIDKGGPFLVSLLSVLYTPSCNINIENFFHMY